LSQAEVDRIAEFYYASVLADDEECTAEHAQTDEDLVRSVGSQLDDVGIEYDMPGPFDAQRPAYGLTNGRAGACYRGGRRLWDRLTSPDRLASAVARRTSWQ
jgi:hypothetical protein